MNKWKSRIDNPETRAILAIKYRMITSIINKNRTQHRKLRRGITLTKIKMVGESRYS